MIEFILIQNVQESEEEAFVTTRVYRCMAKSKKEAIRGFIKIHKHIPVAHAWDIFCLEINEIPLFV